MSVELVQFMSQLLNLVIFIHIFTHVKFAGKKTVDSMRKLLLVLSLYIQLKSEVYIHLGWSH